MRLGRRFGGYGLVLLAAGLWATLGLFYKTLSGPAYHLPPLAIVFWRAGVAAATLFIVLLAARRRALYVRRRDWLLFLGFGVLGGAAFYVVYVFAVTLAGVGMAAVLMYTAPVWVTAFSVVFLREKLTGRKGVALLLAVAGCALVGQIYALGQAHFDWLALLTGLGAGVGYGAYILFSKAIAQRGYSPWAALAYGLGLGALCLLPCQAPADLARVVGTPPLLLWVLALGLIPTLIGGVAFNAGLRTISASNASIVATVEPVIAAFLGWWALGEQMEAPQVLGAALIVVSVVLLQLPQDEE